MVFNETLVVIRLRRVLKDLVNKMQSVRPKSERLIMKLETNAMIRAVHAQDASSISAIYNHYIENTVVTFEEEVVTASEIIKRITQITANDLPWFVAEDESGNILGAPIPAGVPSSFTILSCRAALLSTSTKNRYGTLNLFANC